MYRCIVKGPQRDNGLAASPDVFSKNDAIVGQKIRGGTA